MKTKKILSVLLVALMALALSGMTAFADAASYKITISNSVTGETYSAYKVFDVTYSGTGTNAPHSYSINDTSAWWNVVTDSHNKTDDSFTANGLTFTKTTTANVWNVEKTNSFDAAAFASKLYAANKSGMTAAKTGTGNGSALDLAVTEAGYYFVDTTLGALCALDTTNPTATITEKNTVPTVEKKVSDTNGSSDWNATENAQIGDTVYFKLTVTDGEGTDKAITLEDTLDAGLTYTAGSIKIGGTAVADTVDSDDYKVVVDGQKITFTIKAAKVAALAKDATLEITYEATVNASAKETAAVNNSVTLKYQAQTSTPAVASVKTYAFKVHKYAEGVTNLAGAKFELLDSNNAAIALIKESDTRYRVAYGNENGAVTVFETVASDKIVIAGVDVDVNYSLRETEAPTGYNKLTAVEPVSSLSSDNSTVIEVENKTGVELPSTGALGTTIFYVVGVLAILGAGVFMVTNKRIAKEEF